MMFMHSPRNNRCPDASLLPCTSHRDYLRVAGEELSAT
jgi:hypothetical protein